MLKELLRISRPRARWLKAKRLRVSEAFGSNRWSYPALNDIDHGLMRRLDDWTGPKTFVEAGGNDGLQQSNTYALERMLGWRGVLVELVPQLAAEASINRPLAQIVCAALTDDESAGKSIPFALSDLTTKVGDGRVLAGSTTLSEVFRSCLDDQPPSLLSIDVEGAELSVLAGLDLSRHRPAMIVVETANPDSIQELLGNEYELEATLSHHDYLFERRADTNTRQGRS